MGTPMKVLSLIPASQLYHLTVPFKIRPDEGNGAPMRQGRILHSQIPDHKRCNSALFLSVLDLHYSPILLRGGDFMLVRFPRRSGLNSRAFGTGVLGRQLVLGGYLSHCHLQTDVIPFASPLFPLRLPCLSWHTPDIWLFVLKCRVEPPYFLVYLQQSWCSY